MTKLYYSDEEIDIYNMELHEQGKLDDCTVIQRVPFGWIYLTAFEGGVTSTFVPYHDEFKKSEALPKRKDSAHPISRNRLPTELTGGNK